MTKKILILPGDGIGQEVTASSIEILKEKENIYWLIGGIPKKGDKFNLPKNYYKNIKGLSLIHI